MRQAPPTPHLFPPKQASLSLSISPPLFLSSLPVSVSLCLCVFLFPPSPLPSSPLNNSTFKLCLHGVFCRRPHHDLQWDLPGSQHTGSQHNWQLVLLGEEEPARVWSVTSGQPCSSERIHTYLQVDGQHKLNSLGYLKGGRGETEGRKLRGASEWGSGE